MANIRDSDYIASIMQSVSVISSELDSRVAESVFEKYGANSVYDLNPTYLPDVFSEL